MATTRPADSSIQSYPQWFIYSLSIYYPDRQKAKLSTRSGWRSKYMYQQFGLITGWKTNDLINLW